MKRLSNLAAEERDNVTGRLTDKYGKPEFKYNYLQPLVLGSYNTDYGVQFITDLIWQKQGFRKNPYAFRQSLMINYGFGASSLLLNYNGEFKKAIGNNDLVINILSKGPNYQSYFFGIGNETEYVNAGDKKRRYYRNVYNFLNPEIRLKHTYGQWTASAGSAAQSGHRARISPAARRPPQAGRWGWWRAHRTPPRGGAAPRARAEDLRQHDAGRRRAGLIYTHLHAPVPHATVQRSAPRGTVHEHRAGCAGC